MSIKNYIKAARLRTLPLSVSGIIVGSFLGNRDFNSLNNSLNTFYDFNRPSILQSSIFWLAILTTIGFQIVSNFANDYGDGIKGTDANREGEKRMVSSGEITPKQMKWAIITTILLSLAVASLLIYVSFGKDNFGYSILFFLLGIFSVIAAIKYTVGKSAYGYSGFGDAFVFLFFGLLSVAGSYFLYTKQLHFDVFLPAISIGLLSVAVLNLNNMRDQVQDKKSHKNTLVVKIGNQKAKIYHYTLIGLAFVSALSYTFLNYHSPFQLLFLIAFIPLIMNIKVVIKNIIFSELDSELKKVALSTFLFAILFVLGLKY